MSLYSLIGPDKVLGPFSLCLMRLHILQSSAVVTGKTNQQLTTAGVSGISTPLMKLQGEILPIITLMDGDNESVLARQTTITEPSHRGIHVFF